jgi:hypothetical protein
LAASQLRCGGYARSHAKNIFEKIPSSIHLSCLSHVADSGFGSKRFACAQRVKAFKQ